MEPIERLKRALNSKDNEVNIISYSPQRTHGIKDYKQMLVEANDHQRMFPVYRLVCDIELTNSVIKNPQRIDTYLENTLLEPYIVDNERHYPEFDYASIINIEVDDKLLEYIADRLYRSEEKIYKTESNDEFIAFETVDTSLGLAIYHIDDNGNKLHGMFFSTHYSTDEVFLSNFKRLMQLKLGKLVQPYCFPNKVINSNIEILLNPSEFDVFTLTDDELNKLGIANVVNALKVGLKDILDSSQDFTNYHIELYDNKYGWYRDFDTKEELDNEVKYLRIMQPLNSQLDLADRGYKHYT